MRVFTNGTDLFGPDLNQVEQTCVNIAALRGFIGTTTDGTTIAVHCLGATSAGDGGGGLFYWNAASSASDNGTTVIQPTGLVGSGRWLIAVLPIDTLPTPSISVSDGTTTVATTTQLVFTGCTISNTGGGVVTLYQPVTLSFSYDTGSAPLPGAGGMWSYVGVAGTLAAGASGSFFVARNGATLSTTLPIVHDVNGTITTIGSVNFAAAGQGARQVGTLTVTSVVTVADGDFIGVMFPTADATLWGIKGGLVYQR